MGINSVLMCDGLVRFTMSIRPHTKNCTKQRELIRLVNVLDKGFKSNWRREIEGCE